MKQNTTHTIRWNFGGQLSRLREGDLVRYAEAKARADEAKAAFEADKKVALQ